MTEKQLKMKRQLQRHLIILLGLLVLLCGRNLTYAQSYYSGAPSLSTSGSADYVTIATAINGWATSFVVPVNSSSTNSAFTNRSSIIDQVEATILAAGKATITDDEYDDLADALAYWCKKVAIEGSDPANGGVYGNYRAGLSLGAIGVDENFFGKVSGSVDYSNSQCIWLLNSPNVPIVQQVSSTGYGVVLGANTRLVLFTEQSSSRIYRNTSNSHPDRCNIMFSTNGNNSKLLILGRKNNKIVIDGGDSWSGDSDPSSYTDVLARDTTGMFARSRGQEVYVNSGVLMAAYCTFKNNATKNSSKIKYNIYTTLDDHGQPEPTAVACSGFGGAICLRTQSTAAVNDKVVASFYHTDIKNNYNGISMGGGISLANTTVMTDGIWFNHCNIIGNSTKAGHGGGLNVYIDGGDGSANDKVVFRNSNINYNCEPSPGEQHGGGMFFRATKRKLQMYDCTMTGNYAAGLTCGGGAISSQGEMELTNCAFNDNVAANSFGGAIYTGLVGKGEEDLIAVDLELDGCTFDNNRCTWSGGYVAGATKFNFNRGSGGAVFICASIYEAPKVTTEYSIKLNLKNNCVFTNNHADRNGGAIAIVPNKPMIQYLERSYPATGGGYLTPNFEADLEIASAVFHDNTAGKNGVSWTNTDTIHDCGGAVFLSYTDLSVTGSSSAVQIYDNSATNATYGKGGAIGVYKGEVDMQGGTFGLSGHPNSAVLGGAIYVEDGDLSLSTTNITHNTASTAGGGIYFDGLSTMTFGSGSMKVKDNMVNSAPNNIYLLEGNTIAIASGVTFTPEYVGIFTQNNATAGVSIPVFTGSDEQLQGIYDGMTSVPMTTNVVDDKQIHSPSLPAPKTTLYFSLGSPWSPLQQTIVNDSDLPTPVGDVYPIGSVKDLTAFLWYVNHVTGHNEHQFDDDPHPEANGKLTADIDMTGHYWVPIANYTGTFDGNGYTISNLTMVPTNESTERGLFGVVTTNGIVKNVNLRDGYFASDGDYIGSIVSQMNGGSLYNSVAQCQLIAMGTTTTAGGLVGYLNGGTVHSSIATCEMTGYTMGGLVGQVTSGGNLYNSFANPKFTVSGGTPNVGGLVAENTGQIENCYVRLERAQSLGSAHFGMLAATNSGTNTIVKCYAPDGDALQFSHSYTYLYNNATTGLAQCDLYKKVDAPYLYNRPNNNLVGSTGMTLTEKLNNWVPANSDYAFWNRTTAGGWSYEYNSTTYTGGNINDDYPMPKMKGLSNVASTDGLSFDYAPSLSRAINKYNGLTGGGTVWLYASPKNALGADEEVNVDNDSDVLLYIDEDATLLQAANNSLTAYTSQTLKVETESRWHFISSSLSNSDIGFNYGTTSQVDFDWSENPCNVTFNGNNDDALFPSDMPNINKVDLYAFYEPEYHWLNLKRNTNSHWHMNATTAPIAYNGNGTGGNGNETYLVPGKGYLASIDKDQLLQNKGTLNNGDGTVTVQDVTYKEANAWAGLLGYNLLGNPYQSYLDFNDFIEDDSNSGLNASKGNAEPTYAVYDPEIGSYIQYKSGSSKGSRSANGMIHPHQGFMIRRTGGSYSATATFKNTMRSTNSTSPFRGEQPAFPLVNLTVTDDEGNADVAVLELGRDADRGAEKLRANTCKGWLYLHHDNDDYGILFRSEVEDYQPLWFEASEAGTYTMRWETANGEFESLTLVDNIAGVVTDMLANDSYVFEANPDQYKSRFKIVIGDYKDIEENEGGASTGSASDETFAYYANGEIHLVETQNFASLQIVDMTGRVILSRDGVHTVSTNGIVPGVYVLRLTTDKGTKIQKMVIE